MTDEKLMQKAQDSDGNMREVRLMRWHIGMTYAYHYHAQPIYIICLFDCFVPKNADESESE